jgi:hypothetical protein
MYRIRVKRWLSEIQASRVFSPGEAGSVRDGCFPPDSKLKRSASLEWAKRLWFDRAGSQHAKHGRLTT